MFSFIKNQFSSWYTKLTSKLQTLFLTQKLDKETLKELEQLLIEADTGIATTKHILAALSRAHESGRLKSGTDLREALKDELLSLLKSTQQLPQHPNVILMVGINGSGKTTFLSKLAHQYTKQRKKVLLVAGDTFRAAATQQLQAWADRTNTRLIVGNPNQDPASVIFTGCQIFKDESYDILLIDTAGRLQTKTHLMRELEKIKKIIVKQLPDASTRTLLTIDAMLGQNSREQAKIFHESTQVDGIVLTKMDGSGKGGTAFAIAHEFGIPIAYVSFGESVEQCKEFDAEEFVNGLLG